MHGARPVPLLPFVTQGRCVRSGVSFCRRPRRAGRFQSMATHPWSLREAFRILSPSLRIEIVYLQRLGKVNAFFRAARRAFFSSHMRSCSCFSFCILFSAKYAQPFMYSYQFLIQMC